MFLSSLQLTDEQIAQKEAEFQQLLLDAGKTDEVYRELRDFFAKTSKDDIAKYKYSYWRWYVWLTWNRLNALSEDEIVDIAVGQQIPTALLLDFEVWTNLMLYFVANNFFEGDLESFYLRVKKAFFESEATVGVWQEKNITISEIVREINSIYSSGDSLSQADFESKLKQVMFPVDELAKKYYTADSEMAKDRLLHLVAFFQTFTQENIWFVVDAFLNPEKYQGVAPGEAAPESTSTVVAPGKFTVPETIRPSAPPAAVSKPVAPAQSAPVKPTPVQIKSQIEKEFSTEDVEGIMSKLSELAEKNNDPKIAEMYYFDEKENKFKWNI